MAYDPHDTHEVDVVSGSVVGASQTHDRGLIVEFSCGSEVVVPRPYAMIVSHSALSFAERRKLQLAVKRFVQDFMGRLDDERSQKESQT